MLADVFALLLPRCRATRRWSTVARTCSGNASLGGRPRRASPSGAKVLVRSSVARAPALPSMARDRPMPLLSPPRSVRFCLVLAPRIIMCWIAFLA